MVVVHHGDLAPTLRCVRSVLADPSAAPRRVVVVDNSHGEIGGLEAVGLPEGVHHLPAPDNPGFGAAAGRGVASLEAGPGRRSAAWVLLNHDVTLAPGFLDAAVEALAAPGVGAAGGPVTLSGPDGAAGPLWYAGGSFRPLTGTVRQSRSPGDAARGRDVGFVPGAALAVAPAAWEEIGGFDPRFFLYHEDLDISLRLRRAGWRLRFVPGMRAVHDMGAATGSAERSPFYLEHMTKTRFLPHPSRLYRAYLAAVHAPWVGVRAVTFLARRGPEARARAGALVRGYREALGTVWSRSRTGR